MVTNRDSSYGKTPQQCRETIKLNLRGDYSSGCPRPTVLLFSDWPLNKLLYGQILEERKCRFKLSVFSSIK